MINKIHNFILLAFISFSLIGVAKADECIPGGEDNTLCLSIENIDFENGLLDIIYSSSSDIQNVNMTLDSITIESITSELGLNSGSGESIILYNPTPLPAGENLLLVQVNFTPQPFDQSTCLTANYIANSSFTPYTAEQVCADITSCTFDCNNDCSGTALLDDCDVCSEGNTGHASNSDKDCNGDCFGTAFIDLCEVCSEGNTGHVENSDELGCGCFVEGPIPYYLDEDSDNLGAGDESFYCTELGIETELSTNFTLPPDGWVANSDDPDDSCDTEYIDCAGVLVPCGGDHVCLEFSTVDDTGFIEVSYKTYHPISGFEIDFSGVEFSSIVSDLSDVTFNAENGTIFGIDFSGNQLPSTSDEPSTTDGVLFTAEFIPYGNAQTICIESALVGGSGGLQFNVNLPECVDISGCSNADCTNVCGGEAFIDDCGVCSGGISEHEANSDIDCNGDCFGEAFLDDCGVCSNGESGHEANSDLGCDNVCFSGLVLDDCGNCGGNDYLDSCIGTDNCENMDCNGDCGGEAFLDDCGVCSSGNTGINESLCDSEVIDGFCIGNSWSGPNFDFCGECFGDDSSCGGCMDPNALNYDSEALIETGFCEYLGDVYVALDGNDNSGQGIPGNPYKTIQKAIDMAVDGDTVVVTPGIYEETLIMPQDKNIKVWGLYGPDETIITYPNPNDKELFYLEDFSSSWNGWTQSGTGNFSSNSSHDGTNGTDDTFAYMWYNGCNCSYSKSLTSPLITLPDEGQITVSYDTRQDWMDNCDYDYRFQIIFADGSSQDIENWNCDNTSWRLRSHDVSQYAGQRVQFRFYNYWRDWIDLSFDDFAIHVQEQTDRNQYGSIITSTFITADSTNSSFEGITIDRVVNNAGRVFDIKNSNFDIKNVVITQSLSGDISTYPYQDNGDYIYIENSTSEIENLTLDNLKVGYQEIGNGGIYIKDSSVDFNNLITNNVTVISPEHLNTTYKGSIAFIDDNSHVTINNSIISNSEIHSRGTSAFGSAIYVNSGYLEINGSTFSNNGLISNNSTVYGGAIYMNDNTSLSINESTFDSNYLQSGSSDRRGAAIYLGSNTNLEIDNSQFLNHTAVDGGTIYSSGDIGTYQTTFGNSSSNSNGGAIYINGNLDLVESSLSDCSASSGGSVYINGNMFTGQSYFSSNSSSSNGGDIYINGNLEIIDGDFSSSTASGNGGSIYNSSGNTTINASNISGSQANGNGGALYLSNDNNSLSIIGSNITNSQSGSNGGTIYTDGSINMNDSIIDSSQAGSNGGAIYGDSYETFTLENSSILNSSSSSYGGGIWIGGHSKIDAINSHIDQNSAYYDGGGIYFNSDHPDTLLMNNSTVDNNTSQGAGGGVYLWDDGEQAYLNAFESSISGNNSNSSKGGGIYGRGSLNLNFTEINDNTCENDGGGIWWEKGQITIERSDIRRNHAARGGGAFILSENPIFQFDVIALNDATTIGGGLYIAKQSTASSTPIIFNSTVVYNTSAVLGSGLLCTSQTNPVVQNSIFWGNLAADGVQMHLQGSSEIFVTYSNVAGGLSGIVGFDDIIFQDNIDQFPDFEDIDNEDYDLLITSPCIDTGNPNAPVDPDGTIPDQGAYYFAQDGIPNIGCDIETLDFGGVAQGESLNLLLPVINTGLSELVVDDTMLGTSSFTVSEPAFTVASMATYNVEITFSPSSEGIFDDTITFITNDPDEEEFSVNLHGAGDGLAINSVLDIPNDQGKQVAVAWHRNVFDGIDNTNNILYYNVWREYDGTHALSHDAVLMQISGSTREDETWELMGSSDAIDQSNYSYTCPTIQDAVGDDIYWSNFMVSAHTSDPELYFLSQPSTGYSVDNIAPEMPQNIAASLNSGAVELSWNPNTEEDVSYYNIYRNGEVYSQSETFNFFDGDLLPWEELTYQVSAVDFGENESDLSQSVSVIYNLGDINNDLVVNVSDIVVIVQTILYMSDEEYMNDVTDEFLLSCDIDNNGIVNVVDVVALVNLILN